MDDQQTEGREYTLDIPRREGKEGYVGMLFGLFLRTGAIIADSNFRHTDIRVEYMTQFLISLVPEPKKRDEIRKELEAEIARATKSEVDNDSKAKARNMACIRLIGRISDYTDEHIGISRENKIGVA